MTTDKNWTSIDKYCSIMGYKVEPATITEIQERLRDGHPPPRWVLKERMPTHAIAYFETSDDLLDALIKQERINNEKK